MTIPRPTSVEPCPLYRPGLYERWFFDGATSYKPVALGADRVLDLLGMPGVKPNLPRGYIDVPKNALYLRALVGPAIAWAGDYPYLRDYQRAAVAFAATREGSYLALDVGLGKTLTALEAARIFSDRTLIAAPLYLRDSWIAEMQKWGFEAPLVLSGRPKLDKIREMRVAAEDARFVFCHYDVLQAWEALLVDERFGVKVAIFDELTYLKSKHADRTKGARLATLKCHHLIGLSGTPMLNRPRELWSQLDLLERGAWGTEFQFRARYTNLERTTSGHYKDGGLSNEDELRSRLDYTMLRRTRTDVRLELPPLTLNTLAVEVDTKKHKLGTANVRKLVDYLMSGGSIGKDTLTTFNELRQLASTQKLTSTIDLVQGLVDQGEQVLVFTWYRDSAEKIAAAFGSSHFVHGGLDDLNRSAHVHDFREGRVHVLVATYGALGMGVNLQNVSQVVLHDLDWTPATIQQAIGRAYRLGQERPVVAHFVTAKGTLDEILADILTTKRDLIFDLEQKNEDVLLDALIERKELDEMVERLLAGGAFG